MVPNPPGQRGGPEPDGVHFSTPASFIVAINHVTHKCANRGRSSRKIKYPTRCVIANLSVVADWWCYSCFKMKYQQTVRDGRCTWAAIMSIACYWKFKPRPNANARCGIKNGSRPNHAPNGFVDFARQNNWRLWGFHRHRFRSANGRDSVIHPIILANAPCDWTLIKQVSRKSNKNWID